MLHAHGVAGDVGILPAIHKRLRGQDARVPAENRLTLVNTSDSFSTNAY